MSDVGQIRSANADIVRLRDLGEHASWTERYVTADTVWAALFVGPEEVARLMTLAPSDGWRGTHIQRVVSLSLDETSARTVTSSFYVAPGADGNLAVETVARLRDDLERDDGRWTLTARLPARLRGTSDGRARWPSWMCLAEPTSRSELDPQPDTYDLVRQVLARSASAATRPAWHAWAEACTTEDVELEIDGRLVSGPTAVGDALHERRPPMSLVFLGEPTIELEGERATAHVDELTVVPSAEGVHLGSVARIADRLVLEGTSWRVQRRAVRYL